MYKISEYIIIASKFWNKVDEWNEKLDAFVGTYMDNPWTGAVMLAILFVFAYWGIVSLSKK